VDYFLILLTGCIFIVALLYALSSVKISNDGITTTRWFGSKSLRWTEIARVSSFGQAVRLHNYDDDLILTLDSQLDGYADIVDIVFSKRPDLLDKNDDRVMSISWLGSIPTLGAGLFYTVISASWFFTYQGEFEKFFSLLFFIIGIYFVVRWFLLPKNLTLENENLIVGYWFKETIYSARDIDYISLEKQKTRNGYVYRVQITLTSVKKIKLPTFKQGTFLTYQILKRWHKKAVRS
jgi:hypothetical protein